MQEHIFIQEAPESLDVDALRTMLHTEGCGAIVSFIGITRGMDAGEEVLSLEFDAWQEKLSETLHGLAENAMSQFGLHSIAMAHRTGSVGPGENIVAIHVASPHRKEAFEGCSWLIDELK
ncbi:MAG: molybdopterin synthase catalytic subunit, partial [Candidatus Poseidoniaceae archaeon]